jgi:transglutaminase-like putative cysteine protease
MILPPPFLLGATLLFWGWRADLFWAGAIGALILETAQIIKGRWDFSSKEFNRIWDLCTLLFVGMGLYLRFSNEINAAYTFFVWFPFPLFLMAFGQVYSTREKIPLQAFSWFLRRRGPAEPDRGLNFAWVYFVICLVAAGATNKRDLWFYLGEFILMAWAGWAIRPQRFHPAVWASIFTAAGMAGFAGHIGMQNLQGWFEGRASDWFSRYGRREFDPTESHTAIGHLGRLKLSSRIVLKVHPEQGKVPERLTQATYNAYEKEVWRNTHNKDFNPVPVESDTTTWTFQRPTNVAGVVRVISRLDQKKSLLSLPLNASQVQELPCESVETNSFGAARGVKNPALASYVATFGKSTSRLAPPDRKEDFFIPPTEADTIKKVAEDLQIEKLSPRRTVQALEDYFQRKFRYTTYQSISHVGFSSGTPLANFLLSTRAGHCEYFATATVLLLRQLGIPARYAIGYAVQETGPNHTYIVRERHGHAWTLAWLDNHWEEVDTTPAGWEAEERNDLPYRGLGELWASLSFRFSEWRWLGTKGLFGKVAPWVLIPLLAYMSWRIFGKRLKSNRADSREGQLWPGLDSDFYSLERKLEKRGFGRNHNETALQWIARIDGHVRVLNGATREILSLHYRYRFDPAGIHPAEREQLKQLVRTALQKI